MSLHADRLCLFASPRADDAKGQAARQLRDAGLTLCLWPPLDPHDATPPRFDALLVLGADDEWPAPRRAGLVALLRQAWLQGATIGLFGGAADLIERADIVPGGAAPIEAAGLFIDAQGPGAGTLAEMIDAMQDGPHRER
jgi:hypothetical protein